MRELVAKVTRLSNLSDQQTRMLAAGLGLSLLAFGAFPAVAPGPFARIFGFTQPDAEGASVMRSVGVRDVAMGAGLWTAAASGADYAPWLFARMLADGGDTISVGIAMAQGNRSPRFLLLSGMALAATAADAFLWTLARRSHRSGSLSAENA